MAQLIASLQGQVDAEQTEHRIQYRIWIDTFCCPIELESKLIALERIAGVYRNAAHVLVLDATLTGLNSQDTHPAELLLRIYGASPWMRRLWTLQGMWYKSSKTLVLLLLIPSCLIRGRTHKESIRTIGE